MTDSVGARLRQARELRRLSLQQASESTKLRIHYLQALENDDYSSIPSAAQARGFLRIYADFLELNVADLLPPPQPVAPTAAPAPAPSAEPPAQASRPGFLAAIRQRFGTRAAKESAEPVVSPEPVMAPPAVEPPPVVAAAPEPSIEESASTEVKTKASPRAKRASGSVKKNAAS